jgi:hypothetical protein
VIGVGLEVRALAAADLERITRPAIDAAVDAGVGPLSIEARVTDSRIAPGIVSRAARERDRGQREIVTV